MIQPSEIEALVRKSIPDAKVEVEDFTGGGDHFQITVTSSVFQGKALIDQHRLVQKAIQASFDDGSIHAVQIKTLTPEMRTKERPSGGEFNIID